MDKESLILIATSEYDAYLQAKERGFKAYTVRYLRGRFYEAVTWDEYLRRWDRGEWPLQY